MKKSALIISAILAAVAPCTAFAAAPAVSTDVSLDSTYYDYIDKLDGMGYIESMPMGARPYSRMMMAKWTIGAAAKAKDKPMPKYLAAYLTELQREFAPEIASIEGSKQKNNIRLRSASMQLAYTNMDAHDYTYRGIRGSWQPFSQGNSGYKYGNNGNMIIGMEVSGQLDKNAAILLRPRFSYDKDENGSASLEEGYIRTHIGTVGITAGKEALDFGQGVTGKLALSNNAKPFTMLRLNLLEPQKIGGFFKFLGKEDYNVFYGQLEGNRAETAAANGEHDYDHPGILGMRADYMPTSRFTFGVERISMLGGDRNALDHKDWGDWLFGVNADTTNSDRWDDIAGADFRYRFPGMSIYGELYGEDQSNYLPSRTAQRVGFYFPQLTKDGSWDMRVEYAHTTDVWYDHWTYNNGWVYNGNIMGDSMGPDARKLYIGIKHYLNNTDSIGLNAMQTNMSRESAVSPKLNQFWLTYDHRLDQNVYLDMMAGAAKISNASFVNGHSDKDYIVSATLRWQY